MKRILHISKYFYPYAGGIEDVCLNIVRILQNGNNHQTFHQAVLCFNDGPETKTELCDGIEVTRVGIAGIVASQPIALRFGKVLRRMMREFQPDYIHFHAPNPLAGFFLLQELPENVHLIVHWHSDIVAQKLIYKAIKPLESKLLQRADTIIATSPNYIDGSLPLKPFRNKIVVIPNPIDPAKLVWQTEQVQQLKTRYGNLPIVLFVGRHVPYKGLQYLIQAAPLLKEKCVVLVGGTGPLSKELMQMNTSEAVHFLGRIPDSELATYYAAADVFAFPSVTKNEAFGVALAEAMYCYTPAVTFTIPGSGVNWVSVNGLTGIEVENGSVTQFAVAMDELIRNREWRTVLAQQAHQRVLDKFLLPTLRPALERLYGGQIG